MKSSHKIDLEMVDAYNNAMAPCSSSMLVHNVNDCGPPRTACCALCLTLQLSQPGSHSQRETASPPTPIVLQVPCCPHSIVAQAAGTGWPSPSRWVGTSVLWGGERRGAMMDGGRLQRDL